MLTVPPTPLAGCALPAGGAATLTEAFLSLADRPGNWLQVGAAQCPRAYTGAEVVGLARRWRRALTEAGVRRGDRVALLLPNDERFVGAFFGALLCGAAAVPLAWPATTLDIRRVLALRPLVEAADPAVIVTDEVLAPHFPGEREVVEALVDPLQRFCRDHIDPRGNDHRKSIPYGGTSTSAADLSGGTRTMLPTKSLSVTPR